MRVSGGVSTALGAISASGVLVVEHGLKDALVDEAGGQAAGEATVIEQGDDIAGHGFTYTSL
jgi:hypothetical protein